MSKLTLTSIALALAALSSAPANAQTPPAAEEPANRGIIRRAPQPTQPLQPAPAKDAAPLVESKTATEGAPPATAPVMVPKMDNQARKAQLRRDQFRPDPNYSDQKYSAEEQFKIYGGKHAISMPRPLLELGYPLYAEGEIGPGSELLGAKNLLRPQLLVYGDWRLAAALNEQYDGDAVDDQIGVYTTRLNLDIDLKLTGTERLHFLVRPFDRKGKFTGCVFKAANPDDERCDDFINGNLVTGFLEGDLGAIWQGITGEYNLVDLPFAVGLIPLLFQNGTWMDDAILGGAITIPARNSPALDISNFDITFFAGFDKVTSAGVGRDAENDEKGQLFGIGTFFETREGYIEAGYGMAKDDSGGLVDQSFHSLTGSFTKRYGGWLSNSVRVLGSFGQDKAVGADRGTADGVSLMIENSLITRLPYTLVPYFNFFYNDGNPRPLAREAGDLLKNIGINFETDGLTGFPKLDDKGGDSFGAALGIEYLFNLDQQFVAEVAALSRQDGPLDGETDLALGLRWQKPFWRQCIVRADAIVGTGFTEVNGNVVEKDLTGLRVEFRVKF